MYNLPGAKTLGPLLNGWQMSGIVTLQDGTPLNPFYFAEDIAGIQERRTGRT